MEAKTDMLDLFDAVTSSFTLPSANVPSVFGPYLLLDKIGDGGMADISLAREALMTGDVRYCALKRLPSSLRREAEAVALLREEGRLGALIDHPNLSRQLAAGDVGGEPYLALEPIDGVTLEALEVDLQAPLPLQAVFEIGIRVAEALAYLHALTDVDGTPLRFIHRDVTPQNVMIERHGRVRLVDFGIACFSGRNFETITGIKRGKLHYMAPEQKEGGLVDQRADVYALGLILAELIAPKGALHTGFLNARALQQAVYTALAATVPPDVASLFASMVAYDPKRRCSSAAQIASALKFTRRSLPQGVGLAEVIASYLGVRQTPLERALQGAASI